MKLKIPLPVLPLSMGLWRFGVIGGLLHADPQGRTKQEVINELAEREWLKPDGRNCHLASETIRKWVMRYNVGGLAGLEDQPKNRPIGEEVSTILSEKLFALRKDHPRWTLALLLDEARKSSAWDGCTPSRSTLYRWCGENNLQRDPHLDPDNARAFEFSSFGGLWISDFLHGPRVYVGKQRCKAFLHAVIDDASRFVVIGRFHVTEGTHALIGDLRDLIRTFGIPQRFYSDNGAAFKSHHLRQIGARLRMELPHSPPYRPQGRGKIERFFRTVREQFLAVNESKTLDQLNAQFQIWLAQYHLSIHSTIKQTPLSKRLAIPDVSRKLPETAEIDALFALERRCRVYKDGTIRIHRRSFEVPHALPLSRIKVWFYPWDLNQAWYGDDRHTALPLDKAANAHRIYSKGKTP
ncbi:MAG: helix-turn-helix domain-containing protein [Terrimicrobiaceae bacterium]